jgi:predicted small lipoprotein YifL
MKIDMCETIGAEVLMTMLACWFLRPPRYFPPDARFRIQSHHSRSRPRKGDRHKFPGNCSAALFGRIGRRLKKRGKIEPVPGP